MDDQRDYAEERENARLMGLAAKDDMRAMLEFVDDHYTSIAQAVSAMVERCEQHAYMILADGDMPIQVAGVMHESAEAWRKMLDRFRKLYNALPDREHF